MAKSSASAAATTTTVDPCVPTTTTTPRPGTSGGLPRTGTDSRGLALLGLALVASGGAVVLTVHRSRRNAEAS